VVAVIFEAVVDVDVGAAVGVADADDRWNVDENDALFWEMG
jgi:hypothetical protein